MYSNEKVQKFLALLILILVPICVYKEYREVSLRKEKENNSTNNIVKKEELESKIEIIKALLNPNKLSKTKVNIETTSISIKRER